MVGWRGLRRCWLIPNRGPEGEGAMPKLETITLIQGTSNQSGADSDAGFRLIISKQGLDVRKEIPRAHRTSKADEGGRPYRQGHCEQLRGQSGDAVSVPSVRARGLGPLRAGRRPVKD